MSVNLQMVTILSCLAALALAIRLVAGPIPPAARDGLYAQAKAPPGPAVLRNDVQLAVSDNSPER